MESLLKNKNEFIESRAIVFFDKIKFVSLREAIIFELAEKIGFMKKEAELRQQETIKEVAHDLRNQDTSTGSKPHLKSDEWFNAWHNRVSETIQLLNNKGEDK